jgi:hypothetical protein
MKRQKYHNIACELLIAILDEIGGEEHTNLQIFSEFAAFTGIFEDLVAEIHDDRRWPDRPRSKSALKSCTSSRLTNLHAARPSKRAVLGRPRGLSRPCL